jgi:hypothetical protein
VKKNKQFAQLIDHYNIEAEGGIESWLHSFLTSILNEGEWLASLPDRFSQEETALGTH